MFQSLTLRHHHRERGAAVVNLAKAILSRPRGSPTAKQKVPKLQAIAHEESILGENDFSNAIVLVLLNKARMVPKNLLPSAYARNF